MLRPVMLLQRLAALVLVIVLLATVVPPAHAAIPRAASRYFAQTGYTVQGAFLDYFDQNGGVTIFGYPLSGEFTEDGVTVQYFQRARFEWHPRNAPAYRVQLGLLGQYLHGPAAPTTPPLATTGARQARYFPETGHNVTNVFLDFWNRNGGLANFGFPLTEAYTRGGVTFQWFQRARFEYRNGRVELGLLGSEWRAGKSEPVREAADPLPTESVRRRFFEQTGQVVQGGFLDFWEANGGEARFGHPLSGEFMENGKLVQYFDFARFEWHPANPPASRVLLGLLGQEVLGRADAPAEPIAAAGDPNHRYFPETGHTVSNAFLRYFNSSGGVTVFGYPLTDTFQESGEIVQWFQRRKLVFANGRVYDIPLGAILFNPGNEGRHPAQQVFLVFGQANPAVLNRLGAGLEDAKNPTVVHQPFEGGLMLWRSDTNEIYVLLADGSWQTHANPWREGQPASGGLSAPAGRVEPVMGLGAVWRSLGGPAGKLGWATANQAQGTGTAQRFQRGAMLYNPVNQQIYALFTADGWAAYPNLWPDAAPKP